MAAGITGAEITGAGIIDAGATDAGAVMTCIEGEAESPNGCASTLV